MSVLLCLRPTKRHNCQHILHDAGFLSTPGIDFAPVTMKVYFFCSERPQNCARDCGGSRENQGPKAMAKIILYQLCSFFIHFVQIPGPKIKQQKKKNEVKNSVQRKKNPTKNAKLA